MTVSRAQLDDVLAGLCRGGDQAGTDPAAARITFFDRSHDGVHTIARALEDVDREEATRLLALHYIVEADFSSGGAPAKLRDDLGRLADETRTGLQRLGVGVGGC